MLWGSCGLGRMHCSPHKTRKAPAIQRELSLASEPRGLAFLPHVGEGRGGAETRCNFVLSISTCIMRRQPARKCPLRGEVIAMPCVDSFGRLLFSNTYCSSGHERAESEGRRLVRWRRVDI